MTVGIVAAPASDEDGRPGASANANAKAKLRKAIVLVASVLLVAGIFGFAFPHLSSYGGVWASLTAMSWPSIALIALALAASQLTTWAMMTAVLPSLRLRDAAVVNLGSTAVANTVPGGGAVAMGVSWAMLSSWGIGTAEYVRYTLVSGLWTVFAKLGLPVLALCLLVIGGGSGSTLLAAAIGGAVALLIVVAACWLMLRSERATRLAGRAAGRALAAGFALLHVRRKPPSDLAGQALAFRAGASELVAQRGLRITVTTAASQIALWLVLLACLRGTGVTPSQVSWEASLAAFAFVRLLSALPLTPGGVGVVELGLTASLIGGLDHATAAKVAAAVLLYRAVTYLLPIPLGAAAYGYWRRAGARSGGQHRRGPTTASVESAQHLPAAPRPRRPWARRRPRQPGQAAASGS